MHHRRQVLGFIYTSLWGMGRVGGVVLAGIVILVGVSIPFGIMQAIAGDSAANSLVLALMLLFVYRMIQRRYPGFTLRPRMERRTALTALGVGYALTALAAAVLFIVYSH